MLAKIKPERPVLGEAGVEPRGSRDFDIVLCLEALDADFARAFRRLIKPLSTPDQLFGEE
jgi:hypothetical protein